MMMLGALTLAGALTGPESTVVPAYALYYVCEDVDGLCLYRRQDLSIPIRVRRP